MDEQKILDIRMMNRFLTEGLEIIERPVYREIQKRAKEGLIVVLKGLRRTGKSTLLKYYLLSHKEDAFYYSFDEEEYPEQKDLNDVINYALSMGKKVIGLDEIQKISGWAGTVKKYYDHTNVRFLLSGSSSLDIKSGSESLAGRRIDIMIRPLTFNEYTMFKPFPYIEEYLSTGFPEMLIKNIEPKPYLNSIIDKVVNQDIPKVFNVRKPQVFDDLVRLLAERNTGLLDYRDIATDIEISKDTVKEYVRILEESYLIKVLPVFSKRYSSSARRLKKIMFAFPSLADVLYPQNKGAVYENIIYHHIQDLGEVYFWREKYWEVDFVVKRGNRILPIEVKSGSVNKKDTTALLRFMEKFNVKDGLIVSKDTLDRFVMNGRRVKVVPFTAFLEDPNLEKWLTK